MKALTCAWVFVFVWLCSFFYCLMSGMALGTAVSDGFSQDSHDPQRMDLSIGWIARKLGPDIHDQQRMDPNDINDHVPPIPAWCLHFNYWIDCYKVWYIIPRRWSYRLWWSSWPLIKHHQQLDVFSQKYLYIYKMYWQKKLTCIVPRWLIIITLSPHVSVAPSWGWS